MAVFVYILSAVMSVMCAVLLLRAYRQNAVRLLLWSGLCFVGLALNSIFLLINTRLFPEIDLFFIRNVPTLIGLGILLYGLVWEVKS